MKLTTTKFLLLSSCLFLFVSCNREKEVTSSLNNGDALFAEQKYEEAILAYSQALDESNYSTSELNGDIYFKRSQSYYAIANYSQAEQDVINAINENDEIGRYYHHYGNIHYVKSDWALAVENYDNAEDLDYCPPDLLKMRGLACIKLEKTSKALKNLTKYYKLNPDATVIAEICGNIYFSDEDYDDAYKYYKSYCNYDYTNNGVLEKYSLCANKIGKYQEALRATDTLLKRSVISSKIFELNGEALLGSNQPHRAIEALDSSINLDKSNDRALELRSEAFRTTGDTQSEIEDLYAYKVLRFENAGFFWNYLSLPLFYIALIFILHFVIHPYRERFVFRTPIAYLSCLGWVVGLHYKYLRSAKIWIFALVFMIFLGCASFDIYTYYKYPPQLLSALTENPVTFILLCILVLWLVFDLITLDYQVYCSQTNSRRCKDYLESRLRAVENANAQIIKSLEQYKLPTPEEVENLCRECSADDPEKLRHYLIDGLNFVFTPEVSHRKVRKERNVAKNLAEHAKSLDKSNTAVVDSVRKTILKITKINIFIAEDSMILTKCALKTLDLIKKFEQKSLLGVSKKNPLDVTVKQSYSVLSPSEQQTSKLLNEQLVTKIIDNANDVMSLVKHIPNPHLAALAAGYIALKSVALLADAYCADEYNRAVAQQKVETKQLVEIIKKFDAIKQTLLKISRINVDLINQSRLIAVFYGNNIQDVLYCQPSYSNYYKYRIKKEYSITADDRENITTLVKINTQVSNVIKTINEKIPKK